jgi:catechol 2,3-dioxygenase-like lactoylglutathione lyase family enzyme
MKPTSGSVAISREAPELFLVNDRGFLLALGQLAEAETLSFPEWFHLGFQGESAAAVRALFDRMERDAVLLGEPWTEFPSGTVKFHCFDPSGYRIEVRFDSVR